jgi:hypothetical protein
MAEIADSYRLHLLWSATCSANWGRIVRLDGKPHGNRVGVTVYGNFAEPPPAQHAERPDVNDLYTPIIVVEPTWTVCVTGTIWTAAATTNAEKPLCR